MDHVLMSKVSKMLGIALIHLFTLAVPPYRWVNNRLTTKLYQIGDTLNTQPQPMKHTKLTLPHTYKEEYSVCSK